MRIVTDCENCGAAMRLAESGGYLFCEYCTSLRFVSETDEGVVASGAGSGEHCPACRVELKAASVEGQDVSYCDRCRGILLKSAVFRQVIDARIKRGCSREAPNRIADDEALARTISCPRCRVEMSRHPYYGPGDAVIDCCGECLLLWLDHPELTVIVKAHQQRR